MRYRIDVTDAARAEVIHLPGHVRQRARRLIAALADEPRPDNSKELRGHRGLFRIRLEKWRVVYRVDDNDHRVTNTAHEGKDRP